MQKRKRILTTLAIMTCALSSTASAAQNPFSDVPENHWAYDAVAQLAKDGIIEGYGDATFQGGRSITRYEMAQMVAKAMAKKEVPAADKADPYWEKEFWLNADAEVPGSGFTAHLAIDN